HSHFFGIITAVQHHDHTFFHEGGSALARAAFGALPGVKITPASLHVGLVFRRFLKVFKLFLCLLQLLFKLLLASGTINCPALNSHAFQILAKIHFLSEVQGFGLLLLVLHRFIAFTRYACTVFLACCAALSCAERGGCHTPSTRGHTNDLASVGWCRKYHQCAGQSQAGDPRMCSQKGVDASREGVGHH